MVKHQFDPGYVSTPFDDLVGRYPGPGSYPASDFRLEWGPIFHRGRLDGSARVVVIGQDPAQHENIARRILVGEAGHRVQGFLQKLGIERSYVMINTFLYSVRSQAKGSAHRDDAAILRYRHRWLDALITSKVEAVIALGGLADGAWQAWRRTPRGRTRNVGYARITHPTADGRMAQHDPAKLPAATAALLANWNQGLDGLSSAIAHPDRRRRLVHYGTAFTTADLSALPEADLPAGLPTWMCQYGEWAKRGAGATSRYTITITVPDRFR